MTNSKLFTLSFPDTWKETTAYTFQGPVIEGLQHNLILTIDSAVNNKTVQKSYVNKHLTDARQTMPGFEVIHETETLLSDGTPASIIVFKYFPTESAAYIQKQYYVLKENGMYIFTSTFAADTYRSMVNEVDQIVRSLLIHDKNEVLSMRQL
jgi:hypothetical protein